MLQQLAWRSAGVLANDRGLRRFLGRRRKSRRRECAGRRNWPEAVPKKMSGRKGQLWKSVTVGMKSGLQSVERCELFVTQSDHRIDAHRTPRRKVGRKRRHDNKKCSCA